MEYGIRSFTQSYVKDLHSEGKLCLFLATPSGASGNYFSINWDLGSVLLLPVIPRGTCVE